MCSQAVANRALRCPCVSSISLARDLCLERLTLGEADSSEAVDIMFCLDYLIAGKFLRRLVLKGLRLLAEGARQAHSTRTLGDSSSSVGVSNIPEDTLVAATPSRLYTVADCKLSRGEVVGKDRLT